jgi:hypothetical protein
MHDNQNVSPQEILWVSRALLIYKCTLQFDVSKNESKDIPLRPFYWKAHKIPCLVDWISKNKEDKNENGKGTKLWHAADVEFWTGWLTQLSLQYVEGERGEGGEMSS